MSPPKATRKLMLGTLAVLVLIFLLWHFLRPSNSHPGISYGNGRLEATEVDVSTKVAGRIAESLVREGDNLSAGQVAARLDADDLAAQLRAAEAAARQARDGVVSAVSQQKLALVTLGRTRELIKKGFISGDRLDRDVSALQTADAALAAARNRATRSEKVT